MIKKKKCLKNGKKIKNVDSLIKRKLGICESDDFVIQAGHTHISPLGVLMFHRKRLVANRKVGKHSELKFSLQSYGFYELSFYI